jgi:hypothetical protein
MSTVHVCVCVCVKHTHHIVFHCSGQPCFVALLVVIIVVAVKMPCQSVISFIYKLGESIIRAYDGATSEMVEGTRENDTQLIN